MDAIICLSASIAFIAIICFTANIICFVINQIRK